jgi:protein O-mannosyl-transferase
MSKSKPKKTVPSAILLPSAVPDSRRLPPTPNASFWTQPILHAWLIFIIAFGLYANTLTHNYAQDDAIVITDNMFTQQGISGWGGLLKYDTFYGFFKEAGKANLVAGGRYRPFTLMMFAVEYQFFGKNPLFGHLFNVLWYALTCVVLYFLLLKLLNYKKQTDWVVSGMLAFITTLLFTVHPIHTEVVANIKGRDEIMTLLGSLGAVWFSIEFLTKKKIAYSAISGILFFIALLSKENAITFLMIVPMMYYLFLNQNVSKMIVPMLPFGIATALFLGLRASAIGNQFGSEQMELLNNPFLKLENGQYVPFDFMEKMATILYTLGKYIVLLVFPHPLTHDYYPKYIDTMRFGHPMVLLSLAAHLGLVYWGIKRFFKGEIDGFGILFYLGTLFIVSNIVFPVGTNMAERFVFMPSVGFCLVVSFLLMNLFKNKTNLILTTTCIIAILFGIKTFTRNFDWKDDYTLFTTDVNVSEKSAKVQCSAGGQTIEKAFKDNPKNPDAAMLQIGIQHLKKSIEIHPLNKNAYLLLGNAYFYLKDFDKAIEAFQKTLQLAPGYKDAENNLLKSYREAGQYYGQVKQDGKKCVEYLEKALVLRPNEFETVRLLGVAYGTFGNAQKALEYFQRAVDLQPNNPQAIFDLGSAFGNIGNPLKANELHQKALQLKPDLLKANGGQ